MEEMKSWIKFGHGSVSSFRTPQYNEKFNTHHRRPCNKVPTSTHLPPYKPFGAVWKGTVTLENL